MILIQFNYFKEQGASALKIKHGWPPQLVDKGPGG